MHFSDTKKQFESVKSKLHRTAINLFNKNKTRWRCQLTGWSATDTFNRQLRLNSYCLNEA